MISIDEIRKRIKLLLIENLIMENSINTYIITNKGKLLLEKIKIPRRGEDKGIKLNKEGIIPTGLSDVQSKILEMRKSSRDSSNFSRFEKALRDIFEILGFNAKWIGGSGNTDILLKTKTPPKFSYTVAVDAKSTFAGSVNESMIDFDTIKAHKEKYKADYSLIVGFSFQGGRLIERANQHNVLLLDVDKIEEMVKENQKIPLNFESYRKLFEQKGIANIDVLKEDRNKIEKSGLLMQSIMDCLIEESEDKYTEGILTERDLYRTLKNSNKFINLNPNEIQAMLEFLSSPLIGCVEHTRDGYYAIESLSNISKKLEFYSKSCI